MALSLSAFLPAQEVQAASAVKGGSFSLNLGGEPTTLNPITSEDVYAVKVQGYVMESLMTRHEDSYAWEPALATSYEVSKDGKTYTFKLRPGVKWQDGQPLTVADVVFSFEVIFDPKFPTAHLRPYFEAIEKAEAVDAQTVRFTVKSKYFKNLDVLAGLTVVPKHVYGDPVKGPKLNKQLMGSGPYRLDAYEQGKRIVLKRNTEWWGWADAKVSEGKYNFDQVVLRFVKEPLVSLEMLKKGDLDFDGLTPEMFVEKTKGPEWGSKVFKVKTQNSAPKGYGFIGWNFRNPILADKKVRLALYHLLNRELMIQKFLHGMAVPATGPNYRLGDLASPSVKPVGFDPKKAMALLKEAGWTDTDSNGVLDKVVNGQKSELKLTIMTANQDFMKYLTIFQEDSKKAGVVLDLKYVEWNAFIKLLDDRKFDGVNLGWGSGSVEPDHKQIWHSSSAANGGSNFISYANPEVDKLIDQIRETLDEKKRVPLQRKVFELIAADVPYAFLFNTSNILYGHTGKVGRPKDTFKYELGTDFWWTQAAGAVASSGAK